MKRTRRRISLLLAVGLITAINQASRVSAETLPADEPPPCASPCSESSPASLEPEFTVSASGAGWAATCYGRNDYAHYSKGAGGAIYKTDIWCEGYGVTQLNVWYSGHLRFSSAPGCFTGPSTWTLRASSKPYTQWIGVNVGVRTYYTPVEKGTNGGTGWGWWDLDSSYWFYHDGLRSTTGRRHDRHCRLIVPT